MEKQTENTYMTPLLGTIINWWSGQKLEEDKGGSFNSALYLQYLQAISK